MDIAIYKGVTSFANHLENQTPLIIKMVINYNFFIINLQLQEPAVLLNEKEE